MDGKIYGVHADSSEQKREWVGPCFGQLGTAWSASGAAAEYEPSFGKNKECTIELFAT